MRARSYLCIPRGREKPRRKAGASRSLKVLPNNRKPPVLDGDGHGRINGEPCLFQPGTFEKKKGSIGLSLQGLLFRV